MFFVLIFDFYFCICSHYTSTPIAYPFLCIKVHYVFSLLVLRVIFQNNVASHDFSFFRHLISENGHQPPTCIFIMSHLFGQYNYNLFFLSEQAKITPPPISINPDNICPMVNPHDVRNPICASGARNCSQIVSW